jgi:hypothetical protein
MHPALEAAYAKRDRAREHLDTLEDEADEFMRGYPYRIAVKVDPDSGWYTARLKIEEEPPPRLGILVGEVAYECISALNHLVWELAARKQGRNRIWEIKQRVQLPVCKGPAHFAEQALVKGRLVSRDALAKIEGLQPYRTPDQRPWLKPNAALADLKAIADADKHRILARGFGDLRLDEIQWFWDEQKAFAPVVEYLSGDGVLEDGADISRIRFETGNRHAGVDVDRQPGADILFATDSGDLSILDIAGAWTWLDRLALPLLAPLFPD